MTRKCSIPIFVILIFFATPNHALAQHKKMLDQIRHTVVFLGQLNDNGQPTYSGTGFLVSIEGYFHLVTAKHIVMENINGRFTGRLIDHNLRAFFNDKKGRVLNRALPEIKERGGVNWIFHDSIQVDVALIPFPIDTTSDDVLVIPDSYFLSTERLFEVYDVFFLSFQPGLESATEIMPIFRTGTISLMRKDKSFYIDAFAFPGNSGSPVFLKPSFARFDEDAINFGGDTLANKFIGLVGEYLPYQEVAISAQTLRPRVIFEENTGLSKVWSISYIREIIQSNAFTSQLRKLKSR